MEKFDEAARGLLGSMKLMWALRFRNVAVVGAALTILTLPLDAVIQSAVQLPVKHITINTTYIPRSTWYDDSQIMTDEDHPWPSTNMMNAIKWGHSYDNGLDDLFDLATKVDCPTGYCQFKKSQTLAISSTCINRTADIKYTRMDESNNIAAYQTLPGTGLKFFLDGVSLDGINYQRQIIDAESLITWPETPYPGVNFDQKSRGPIILRTPMMVNWQANVTNNTDQLASYTMALECALYWSVRTETMFVDETSSHQLSSKVDNIAFNSTADSKGLNRWLMEPRQCFVDGKEISNKKKDTFYKDNCLFAVSQNAARAFENIGGDNIDGLQGTSYLKNSSRGEWTRTNNFVTNLYATRGSSIKAMADRNLESWNMINIMWHNIAYGMSYTVRRSKSRMDNGHREALNTTGEVLQPIYYWRIDWPRLAAPTFVVVFAAFFVLYTAIITRKEYAWRRSALPLLFHGLEDRKRIALGDVRSFIAMQDVANRLHVRLDEHIDANGARFTTQH